MTRRTDKALFEELVSLLVDSEIRRRKVGSMPVLHHVVRILNRKTRRPGLRFCLTNREIRLAAFGNGD